jgi:thiosulfate/3-mercaptopyruvate sulfurtransferase
MRKKFIKGKFIRTKAKFLAFIASFLALAIAIPLLPFSPTVAQTPTKIQFVSPEWVIANANDPNLRILDVRINPFDYFIGHLPNAVHLAENTLRGPNGILPVQYWQPEKLVQTLSQAGVTDNSRVLIYSDARDVLGATMVAYTLERLGHTKEVAVLDGGFAGYEASQPVTQEFPNYQQGKLTLRDKSSIRVTLDEVKSLIGKPGVTFIDPRPPKIFQGEEKIWVRNGHIPGARNIPWPTFTLGNAATDEGNFHQLKPLSEIQKLLADRGITQDQDIIVTCSTGREATLQYVVLKHLLGYPKVRVYEGSWTEYSSQPDLPVATGPEKAV